MPTVQELRADSFSSATSEGVGGVSDLRRDSFGGEAVPPTQAVIPPPVTPKPDDFPGGVIRAFDPLDTPATTRFMNALKATAADFGFGTIEFKEEQLFTNVAGKAGTAGSLVAGLVPSAVGLLVPSLAPAVIAGFMSKTGHEELVRSGNPTAAVGLGMITGAVELLGLKSIEKIGVATVKEIGKLVTKQEFGAAAKVLIGASGVAVTEGLEESVELTLSELWLAGTTDRTLDEAVGSIKENLPQTFILGTAGGSLLIGPSLLSPSARAAMRARVDDVTTQTPIVEPEAPRIDSKAVEAKEGAEPAKAAEGETGATKQARFAAEEAELDADAEFRRKVAAATGERPVGRGFQEGDAERLAEIAADFTAEVTPEDEIEFQKRKSFLEELDKEIDSLLKVAPDSHLTSVRNDLYSAITIPGPTPSDSEDAQLRLGIMTVSGFFDRNLDINNAGNVKRLTARIVKAQAELDNLDPDKIFSGVSGLTKIEQLNRINLAKVKAESILQGVEDFIIKNSQDTQEAVPEDVGDGLDEFDVQVVDKEGDVDGPKLGEIPGFSVDAVKNTLNEAMGDQGRSALGLIEVILDGHNAEAGIEGSSTNFIELGFAITPDEFNSLTPSQKRRATQNGVQVSEDQANAILEVVGGRLYDQAFDEATGAAGAATEQFANQVLQNSAVEDPNLVLAAYMFTQRAEASPEERGRRRPVMQADDLSVGQNFEILGKRFEVRQTSEGRTFVAEDMTLNANGLTHIPVDSGTLKNAAGDLLVASNRAGQAVDFVLMDIGKRLLAGRDTVDALRNQLFRLVRTRFQGKKGIPKSLLTPLENIKTPGDLAAAIRKVRQAAIGLERIDSMEALSVQKKKAEKSKKIPSEYKKAIDSILGSIGGTDKNPALTSKIKVPANLPPEARAMISLAAEAEVGPLSAEDAIAISEGIADILNGARLANKLRNQNDSIAEAAVVDAIAEELSREGGLLGKRDVDENGKPIPFKNKGFLGNRSDAAFGLEAVLTPDTMASVLSGGRDTVFHKIFYGLLAKARTRVLQGVRAGDKVRDDAIADAGFKIGDIELARLSPVFSPAHDLWQKIRGVVSKPVEVDVVEVRIGDGKTVKMHRGERMSLALNLRDAETRELIIGGTPITLKTTFAGENFTMTEEEVVAFELEFSRTPEAVIADAMFSHVNGPLRVLMQEWSESHLGYDITKGFDHWARQREKFGKDDDIADALKLMGQRAIEATGMAKERSKNSNLPIALGDAFVSYSNQVWVTNSLAHVAPSIYAANKAIKSSKVQKIIQNSGRRNLNGYYELLFNHMAKEVVGDQRPSVPLERSMGQIANNIGSSALALNPRVVAYQPVSIFAAVNEIERRYIVRALASGAFFNTNLDPEINRSAYLFDRKNSSGQQLVSEGESARLAVEGVKQRGYYTFMGIRWADNNAIRVIHQAAKYKAAEVGGNALEMTEGITQRTQPTGDTLHISGLALQSRTQPAIKMFTLWRAQLSKQLNLMYEAYLSGDRQKMKTATATIVMSSLTINVIRAAFGAGLITLGEGIGALLFGGDEPEFELPGGEDALEAFNGTVTSLFAHIPIFGEALGATVNIITNGVLERYGSRDVSEAADAQRVFTPSNPITSMVEEFAGTGFSVLRQSIEGDLDNDELFTALLNAVEAAGALFGLPIVAPLRLGKKVAKGVEKSTD